MSAGGWPGNPPFPASKNPLREQIRSLGGSSPVRAQLPPPRSFSYRTRPVIREFVPQIAVFRVRPPLYQSRRTKKADFGPPSLHRKIPFLARRAETGSKNWGPPRLLFLRAMPFLIAL